MKSGVITKCSLGLLLILSFFSLSPEQILASNNETNITITPLIFSRIVVNPNDKVTNVLKVYNPSVNPELISIYAKDFLAFGENGSVKLVTENNPTSYSLQKWISFDNTIFTIQPKSFQLVKFSISVPQQVEPGGRYASIIASTQTLNTNNINGSSIGSQVGSLLFVTIAGEANEQAKMLTFNTKALHDSEQEFTMRIKNNGNIHVNISGQIIIYDMFHHFILKKNLNNNAILPQAIRQIREKVNTGNKFGYYTATASVNYSRDNKKNTLVMSTYFWVLPIIPIIVCFIILAAVIIFRKKLLGFFQSIIKK